MRWLFVLLLAAPFAAAQAFPVDAELDVYGEAYAKGDGNLAFGITGAMLDDRDGTDRHGNVTLDGDFAYSLFEVRERYAQGHPGSPAGTRRLPVNQTVELLDEGFVEGLVRAERQREEFSLRLLADNPLSIITSGGFEMSSRVDTVPHYASRPSPELAAETYDLPGPGSAWEPLVHPPMAGSLRLQVYGAVVQFEDGSSIETGHMKDKSTTTTVASTEVAEMVHHILVLEGQGAVRAGGDWRYYVQSVVGAFEGDVELVDVAGHATINGSSEFDEAELFQVKGAMHINADYTTPPSHWRLGGTAYYAGVNAAPVAGDRDIIVPAIIATGIAAVLIALLLKGLGLLREFLPFVSLRHADALGNENRMHILKEVSLAPGISPAMIQRRLDLSRATVSHHLSVLRRAKLIEEHREGKIPSMFLNSGSFQFRMRELTTQTDANSEGCGAAEAFAALNHPRRRALHDAIQELGQGDYAALCSFWQHRGLTPLKADQVSYHGKKLEQASLVSRSRQGRRVMWQSNPVEEEALLRQWSIFVREHQLDEVVRYLQSKSRTDVEWRPAAAPAPSESTEAKLRLLEGIGLVERRDDGTVQLSRAALKLRTRPRTGVDLPYA